MSARRWGRVAALLALLPLAAACSDDGPSGAGTVTLTVEAGQPLGGAVLDLRGGTVESVEPLSSGWAILEPLPGQGSEVAHRLLVVQEQAGVLTAKLRVTDRERLPSVTVLQASGADDRPLAALGGVEARIRR